MTETLAHMTGGPNIVQAMEPEEFVAIVKRVLAAVPPPRLGPGTDVEALAVKLVEGILAAFPPPPRGLTHLALTSDGEAIGHVQGSSVDFRRSAKLLRALTAAAQQPTDVMASRHGRTLTPLVGVRAVAEASGGHFPSRR